MKRIVLSFLTLVGLASCEKDAKNIPIPFEKKLVIESYLSPQDTELRVSVSRNFASVGAGSSPFPGGFMGKSPIPNATVTLSDGQRSVVLPFGGTTQLPNTTDYRLPASALPIVPGRTYTLQVSAPGYPDAEATCTIPLKYVEASTAEITKGQEASGTGTRDYYQAVFTDLTGEENYYSTALAVLQTVTPPPAQGRPYTNANTQGTVFHNQGTTDGGKIKTAHAYAFSSGSQVPANWLQIRQLELVIATTDQAYFDYNRTLRQQQRTGDNPFAEPVLTYSNIRGGLGVFAGYQLSRIRHTL